VIISTKNEDICKTVIDFFYHPIEIDVKESRFVMNNSSVMNQTS
jgi:hypothetical protein